MRSAYQFRRGAALSASIAIGAMAAATAPALAADAAHAVPAIHEQSRVQGKLVLGPYDDATFAAVDGAGQPGAALAGKRVAYEDASERAGVFTFPAAGSIGAVVSESGLCLEGGSPIQLNDCTATAAQSWVIDSSGALASETGERIGTDRLDESAATVTFVSVAAPAEDLLVDFTETSPVLTAVATPGAPASASVLISGTATPGSSLRVAGSAELVVDDSGEWSQIIDGLDEGSHAFEVEQRIGGLWQGSVTVHASIEATTPTAVLRVDAPAPVDPASPGIIAVSGSANAGATVQLRSIVSGAELGATVAAEDGSWRAQINKRLGAGTYTIAVVNGDVTERSTFVVGAPVAHKLVVAAPATSGTVAAGRVVFSGTAAPGAPVALVSRASGMSLGGGVADAQGAWSAEVNKPLGAGAYTIRVESGSSVIDRAFVAR